MKSGVAAYESISSDLPDPAERVSGASKIDGLETERSGPMALGCSVAISSSIQTARDLPVEHPMLCTGFPLANGMRSSRLGLCPLLFLRSFSFCRMGSLWDFLLPL